MYSFPDRSIEAPALLQSGHIRPRYDGPWCDSVTLLDAPDDVRPVDVVVSLDEDAGSLVVVVDDATHPLARKGLSLGEADIAPGDFARLCRMAGL